MSLILLKYICRAAYLIGCRVCFALLCFMKLCEAFLQLAFYISCAVINQDEEFYRYTISYWYLFMG